MIKDKKDSNKGDFCLNIEKLRNEYEKLKNNYALPEFLELNKTFDIEEIEPETEFLLRKIRRYISEKIGGYMRFIEILLNPSNAPMFFFKLIKKLDNSDKEALSVMYDTLGRIELETISLDLEYDEKKEALFIRKLHDVFNQEIKKELLKILKKLENGEDNRKKESNGSYFG